MSSLSFMPWAPACWLGTGFDYLGSVWLYLFMPIIWIAACILASVLFWIVRHRMRSAAIKPVAELCLFGIFFGCDLTLMPGLPYCGL